MSWLDLIWAAAVAVLTLGAIGGSLAWAVGLKGYWAVAVAPAFALTLIGGTAIVAPWLGLSWSLVPVLILTALIAAALWFVRRITRRARSGEPSGRRPFDFWLLLGLAIAAELTRGHGGKLELVSTGAEGTSFAIRLPKTLSQLDAAAE